MHFLGKLGYKYGYSDHTMGLSAPLVSISKGVSCLEVHFTIDSNLPGPDQLVSKTPAQLKVLKEFIQQYSPAIGTDNFGIIAEEYETWRTQKKSLHALRDISKGEIIDLWNTTSLSPPVGLSPLDLTLESPLYASEEISVGTAITKSNTVKGL